jgi:hypothetical protein
VDSGHYISYVWRPTALTAAVARKRRQHQAPASAPIAVPTRNVSHRKGRSSLRPSTCSSLPRLGRSMSSNVTELRSQRAATSTGSPPSVGTWQGKLQQGQSASLDSSRGRDRPFGGSQMAGSSALSTSWPMGVGQHGGGGHLEGAQQSSGGVLGSQGDEAVLDWEELADESGSWMWPAGRVSTGVESADARESRGDEEEIRSAAQGDREQMVAVNGRGTEGMGFADLMKMDHVADVGTWVRCDDESTSAVPWQTVAQAQAYLLMYELAVQND